MHPKKFAVWLFIISITMIFAAMTSAYIVKQGDGNWLIFDMPMAFLYTSVVIVLSSVTMQWAYFAASRDNLAQVKWSMALTVVLSFIFLVGQYYSWLELIDNDVFFVGNPAGSFVYVFSGLHAFHLISGIVFLIIVLSSAMKYKVHSRSMVQIEMCATYWHFLGGLWLYLYLFLILNN
ncbi:MAG: cytochrome c oxidase subunit 3 [Cyclobacteriaceae bacterium]